MRQDAEMTPDAVTGGKFNQAPFLSRSFDAAKSTSQILVFSRMWDQALCCELMHFIVCHLVLLAFSLPFEILLAKLSNLWEQQVPCLEPLQFHFFYKTFRFQCAADDDDQLFLVCFILIIRKIGPADLTNLI